GYTSLQGTSMASPHVTGGTAVLLQKNQGLTVQDLYDLFRNYCDQPSGGGPYPNNNYGWGRINLWRSLQAVPTSNRPNVVLSRTNIVNDNNGNGKLDPGENAGIVTYVKNTGGVAATNVQGRLRTTSPYITITDSTYTYGTINPGDSANNASDPYDISVHASTPPGHVANFQLALIAAETTWVRTFSYQVGIAPGEIIWGPKSLPNFPTSQFIYGVAYDRIGDRIYVLDFYSTSIRYYSSDSFVTYYGAITGPADSVTDITYSRIGDALYVCAFNPKTVWKINKSTGGIIRQFNNPANDYPVGLALRSPNTMWFADRRSSLGAAQLIYIGDTLGSATQYNSPVQGYYNTRCLAYDSLGNSFVNVQTWFNSGGTALDSVGVVEMSGSPPTLTGRRFLLNPGWNIRGIEFDPRDGNYWITIVQISGTYVNQIVKVRGFYTPLTPVEESEKENVAEWKLLKVVPNPAKNKLSFHINPNNIKHNYLSIYDISGRLVAKVNFDKSESVINWNPRSASLADGIYFVMLEKDDGVLTQKFVLTH
ncbi:MAG: T9SS type A sorting domain-containing protein, partial [candidate division WOR-3 bacterium]